MFESLDLLGLLRLPAPGISRIRIAVVATPEPRAIVTDIETVATRIGTSRHLHTVHRRRAQEPCGTVTTPFSKCSA